MEPVCSNTLAEASREEGFSFCGGFDTKYLLESPWSDFWSEHQKKYSRWIDSGNAEKMQYLVRGLERRLNLDLVLPGVQSVFCVGLRYSAADYEFQGKKLAKYIQGEDYHRVIHDGLRRVAERCRLAESQYKICVDTSAVLERSLAYFAGLGFIGKNKLLIHPMEGSYFLIGVLFLKFKIGLKPKLMKSLCGSCKKCIESCPTQVFQKDDFITKRCISYQTLENRGSNEEFKNPTNWIAGCDICQDFCPFNHKKRKKIATNFISENLNDRETYLEFVKKSSLSRVKYEDFQRNIQLVSSEFDSGSD